MVYSFDWFGEGEECLVLCYMFPEFSKAIEKLEILG